LAPNTTGSIDTIKNTSASSASSAAIYLRHLRPSAAARAGKKMGSDRVAGAQGGW
jgi:hypothetical protein